MLRFLNTLGKSKSTVFVYTVIILTLVIFPFGELFSSNYDNLANLKPEAEACGDSCHDYCELTLTKSDVGYDPVAPGGEIIYYLTLKNTGTDDCTGGGVRLRDYFDQRTSYVSYELGGDYPSNEDFKVKDDYLQWNFATMHPGDLREVWLTMKVDDDVSCDDVLVNKAKYYSNETGWSDYLSEETSIKCQSVPQCGNGILEEGEQCDDGNLINGDGCSSSCQLEDDTRILKVYKYSDVNNNGKYDSDDTIIKDWEFTMEDTDTSDTVSKQTNDEGYVEFDVTPGDTYVLSEELPENWQHNYVYAAGHSFPSNYGEIKNPQGNRWAVIANGEITFNSGVPVPDFDYKVYFGNYHKESNNAQCGNGILEEGEQCDDGNLINGDGCSSSCQLESAFISGCKYNDTDNDGQIDDENETISGWEIDLVGDNGDALFAKSTTTDETGCYVFSDLKPGHYRIAEGTRNGWTQTYPDFGYYEFDLNAGEFKSGVDFGNYYEPAAEVGSISGCKYNDTNNNGTIDDGENKIPGWEITITYPDKTQVSTITDEDGCYVFNNLPSGTYIVNEEDRDGWTQTYPGGDGAYTINLVTSENITNKDFANYQKPTPYCGDGNVDPGEECDLGEANGGDQCTVECTIPTNGMDLTLDKKVNVSSVEVGQSVVFTITLKNEGNADATGVVVEDRMDNGLTYISNTVSKGDYNSDSGIWTVGDMASGEIATLSLVVQVDDKAIMTNVAEVMEHNEKDVDSTPGNGVLSEDDQDDATVTGTTSSVCTSNCGGGGGGGIPTSPQLVIEKSAAVSWTNPDTTVDYTVSITNTGNAIGKDLTLEDALPDGLEYASSSVTGYWELGDIDINQTKTVKYQLYFPGGLNAGDYTNTAVAKISNGNSVQDEATVEVRTASVLGYQPILAIEKNVDRSFTNPGGEAVYTVIVKNINTDTTAKNVILVDRLPKDFSFAEDGLTVKSWVLGDLAPGEDKTITYTVKVANNTKDGVYKNIATAYADNTAEVSDIKPLEVRQVVVEGFTLPDTNGSTNFFLTLFAGLLLTTLGFLLHKYRQLQMLDM